MSGLGTDTSGASDEADAAVFPTNDDGYRWVLAAAAIAGPVAASVAWFSTPQSDRSTALALCLVVAVAPIIAAPFFPKLPPALVVASTIPMALFAFGGGDVIIGGLGAVAILVAVPRMSHRAGIASAVIVGSLYLVVAIVEGEFVWVVTSFWAAAAWCGARALATLFTRVQELQRAGRRAAEDAARAERRHLAREVHDLVAHALTGTMLSLAEVRLLLDRDREAVLRALDEAERLARSSLSDLRRTVRLLSEEGDPQLEPPIELEDDLDSLLDGYRRAGVDVSYGSHGVPLALSVTSAWCAFRIVQESLTNAVRHSPGAPVEVRMEWDREGVTVIVRNGLAVGQSAEQSPADEHRRRGQGILGMSERVRLLGGRFSAGPTSTGWLVTGWIPAAPVDVVPAL